MANFHYFWFYTKYDIFRLRKALLGINIPTFGAIIMRHVSTLHIKYISWFFGWIEVSYDKIFTPTPIDFGEKSGKNIYFLFSGSKIFIRKDYIHGDMVQIDSIMYYSCFESRLRYVRSILESSRLIISPPTHDIFIKIALIFMHHHHFLTLLWP